MGNPSVHNYGMMTHQSALFTHIRTNNRFSATSVDQLPHHLVGIWLFGHKLMFPIPDIDRTDYFLMLGANPIASNGSIWALNEEVGIPRTTDLIKEEDIDEIVTAALNEGKGYPVPRFLERKECEDLVRGLRSAA